MIPERGLTFAELTGLIARLHAANEAGFQKVYHNVKYLQRQKAAPNKAVGRGMRALYDARDVWQTVLAAELHGVGFTPIQIHPIVDAALDNFIAAVEARERFVFSLPLPGRAVILTLDAAYLAERATAYFASLSRPKPTVAMPASPPPTVILGGWIEEADRIRVEQAASFLAH